MVQRPEGASFGGLVARLRRKRRESSGEPRHGTRREEIHLCGTGDCERCAAGWQVTQMNRPRKSVSNLLLTERYLVPLLLTGVRLHPPGRTDENLCRCFGAPACRVFPDHLITTYRPRERPASAVAARRNSLYSYVQLERACRESAGRPHSPYPSPTNPRSLHRADGSGANPPNFTKGAARPIVQ